MTNGTAILEPPPRRARGLQPGVPIRLRGTWNDYIAIAELMGDRRLRTNFIAGEMEFLMPSIEHETWTNLLGRLIEMLTLELAMAIRGAGMTTFRREDLERGLEPDRCYYLQNEQRIRGKKRLDLSIDPPPDLALEIEITSSAEPRMRIYAGLGVPEVWRFDGETITVNQLVANGEYVVAERSKYFPFLPVQELVRFMKMQDRMDDNALVLAFRDWVRKQIETGWATD